MNPTRNLLLTLTLTLLLALAACGSTTTAVTTVQSLASPIHILPEANAAFVSDINLQGMGVCSEGDFTLVVEWEGSTGRSKVAEITHRGQLGAAAYAVGRDEDGWFVERMDGAEGAKKYPEPFAKCAPPAALRAAPAPRKILWREGQSPAVGTPSLGGPAPMPSPMRAPELGCLSPILQVPLVAGAASLVVYAFTLGSLAPAPAAIRALATGCGTPVPAIDALAV